MRKLGMRRRALRYVEEEDKLTHQLPYVLPVMGYAREKASPVASFFWILGGLALLLAFLLQFVDWLAGKFSLPISIPADWLGWTPWMFAIGLVMSIISIFIKPTGGKILLFLLLAAGYVAIATGWLSTIVPL